MMERFKFANGVANVHDAGACAGEFCCIHNPSMHPMIEEPMLLRETTLVERLCQHGIGHPDPDSAAYVAKVHGDDTSTWMTHGCDGCCTKLKNHDEDRKVM